MAVKKDDNSPRGNAARDAIAAQQRERRRRNRGTGEVADWTNADAILIHQSICSLTGTGGAIQFGFTRDGSAYSIRILGDGEPFTEYVRPTEDINEYLRSLILDYSK